MRNSRCLLTLILPFCLYNCTSDKSQTPSNTEVSGIEMGSDTLQQLASDSTLVVQASEQLDAKTEPTVSTQSEKDRIENEQFRIAELKRRESLRSGKPISEITLADIGENNKVSNSGAKFDKIVSTKTPQKQAKAPTTTPKTQQKAKVKKPVVAKAPAKTGTPNIVFKTREYSFDTITEGDVINYSFKFTNTGDAPFEVISAEASCGCTRPSFPFLAIEPGQEGKIGVTYDSRTKSGKQNPKIEIQTDFQDYPITLFLNGYVKDKPKVEVDLEEVKVDTQQIK